MNLAFASLAFACPACGAAGGLALFLIVLGVFVLMFAGTILLFLGGVGRKEWRDGDLRWSALEAEERDERR